MRAKPRSSTSGAAHLKSTDSARPPSGRFANGEGSAGLLYRSIIEGLYLARYVPGQRLVEPDLMRDYGVGRGTVREALNRLSADGIVSLTLHRGALVRALGRDEVSQIFALLETLIGFMARTAAERIGAGRNRALLAESHRRVTDPATRRDLLSFARARDGFYRTLIEIGGNKELARVMRGMHVHLIRTQFRAYSAELETAHVQDYDRIAAAVLAAKPRQADTAARIHIRRVAATIERLPDAAFALPASPASHASPRSNRDVTTPEAPAPRLRARERRRPSA
jgi:DNA-binding GntR family transcriptional regulator